MLSAKGLIKSKPRQGIRILPTDNWNILDPDLLSWSLAGEPSLSLLKEFLEMRTALEPAAAAYAAKRATSEQIANIASAFEALSNSTENSPESVEADIFFHTSVLQASGNRFYYRMRDLIRTALTVSISYTNVISKSFSEVIKEHGKVLDAIQKGNVERARSTMFLMLDDALSVIEQKMEE